MAEEGHGYRRLTIKDLARIAGVSHSTVSRSLNDSPLISEETKKRIKSIAESHNFVFNSSARSLATRRTGIIGVVYPELFSEFKNTLYLGLLENSVRRELENLGFDSVLVFPTNGRTGERNVRRLITEEKVDGLLIVHPDMTEDDWKEIAVSGTPTVILHYHQLGLELDEIDTVFTDHRRGGYLATNHLIRAGRRKILCLALNREEVQFRERLEGYRIALEEFEIPASDWIAYIADYSFQVGYEFVAENMDTLKQVDAVFAQADLLAIGMIQALKDNGFRVPDDIAVVGYDDIEIGDYFQPRLTTVHQDRDVLARVACERVAELVRSPRVLEPFHRRVEPTLVVRDSCGSRTLP